MIIMGRHIRDHLRWCFHFRLLLSAPGFHRGQDLLFQIFPSICKSRFFCLKDRTFDGISRIVRKHPYLFIQKMDMCFIRQESISFHSRFIRSPRLSKNQLFPGSIAGIQFLSNPVHQLHIQKSHQVKAESIHMVLFGPVQHRLQNVFGTHCLLTCHIISTGRSIGNTAVFPHPVEIPRHRLLKPGIQRIGVVINHIHNDPKSLSVQSLDRFFQLPDPNFPMKWICGIRTFRHIIIQWIISPVESIRSARLIYRSIVIHRHQLYIIDPEIFQIRKSCRMFSISIQRSIFATKCRIFPSYLYWKSAGCIPGKLFDMQLIDYLLCFFFRRFI